MRRIVVVGCGGVGGVAAARLARAGFDVTAVTHNRDIADAISAQGLTATYDGAAHTVRLDALPALESPRDPFELALLAVPPVAARDAVANTLPFLTDTAPVVCCPNGLVEERLQDVVDVDRIVGGIVTYGATMEGPGRVRQTAPGGLVIGQLPGATRDLADVDRVLSHVGPIQRSDNLRGARWSKLAINCAISALGTVAGERLGVVTRGRPRRRLMLDVVSEAVRVADAEKVALRKLAGTLDLNWLALPEGYQPRFGSFGLLARHSALLIVAAKYRNMRSSVLRAIERGRDPGIEFLNGEIVERGRRHGIATPVNEAVVEAIQAIAAGQAEPSLSTLGRLHRQTR